MNCPNCDGEGSSVEEVIEGYNEYGEAEIGYIQNCCEYCKGTGIFSMFDNNVEVDL